MRISVNGSECYAYTGSRRMDPAQPTLGFVHGAATDHSVWALQSRYFAHHGSMFGSGSSGAWPVRRCGVGDGRGDCRWIPHLSRRGCGAGVVGHSLGSLACSGIAARHRSGSQHRAGCPTAPMLVSDELLRASREDMVSREMIVGWSISAEATQRRTVPGM